MSEVLLLGNSLEVLKDLPDNSIDSVVTDPPYGLSFMGKKWDYDVPSVELWKQVFRVLKPGGNLLSFGGTRTYHRMVVNIEDAGFEIRDQIMWLYGSGFPKSQNVAIQIDKQAGAMGHRGKALNMSGAGERNDIETYDPAIGMQAAPAHVAITDAAKTWQGWGTALKPANEPICVARKPLEKGLTVAANVLKWGTGAINVDASRIGNNPGYKYPKGPGGSNGNTYGKYEERGPIESTQGRWPANLILDETAAEMLDEQSGVSPSNERKTKQGDQSNGVTGWRGSEVNPPNDSGGASRFFYVAKASKRERNAGLEGMPEREKKTLGDYVNPSEGRTASKSGGAMANHHPTVKPVKLMEYLVRLVTPPNGVCLDPFMGSGTTGIACKNLGFAFLGIEMSEEYLAIAERRVNSAKEAV